MNHQNDRLHSLHHRRMAAAHRLLHRPNLEIQSMIDAFKWLSIMAFVAIAIPLIAIMLVCLGIFSMASKGVVWAVTTGGET